MTEREDLIDRLRESLRSTMEMESVPISDAFGSIGGFSMPHLEIARLNKRIKELEDGNQSLKDKLKKEKGGL